MHSGPSTTPPNQANIPPPYTHLYPHPIPNAPQPGKNAHPHLRPPVHPLTPPTPYTYVPRRILTPTARPTHPYYPLRPPLHQIHIPSPSGGGLGWGHTPSPTNAISPYQHRNPTPTITPNPSPAQPPNPKTAENGGKNKNPQHRQPHPAATQPPPRAVKAHNRNPMPYIHHTNQTRQTPPLSS